MKKITLLLFLLVIGININLFGQATCTANDVCANAYLLNVGTSCTTTTYNIAGCIDENATPDCSLGANHRTIWFKFIATASTATVTVTGNVGTNPVVGVSSNCTSSTRPTGGTCVNSTGAGGTETLNLTGLITGDIYYVSVYDFDGDATGGGTICITSTIATAAPSNNTCSNATTIIPSANCLAITGTTNLATDENATGDCTLGSNQRTVWYKFTATQTSHSISVDGFDGFDPVVGVLNTCGVSGSPKGGDCINATGVGGKEVLFLSGLSIGTSYFIQVYDFNGNNNTQSNFTICVTNPVIPSCGTNPNPTDACGSAPLITNLDGFCGNTNSYTADGTFTGCAGAYSINNNSYFRFIAGDPEVTINYWITGGSSCASGIQLALLSGTCGSLTSLACAVNPTGGTGSAGVFNIGGLTPGNTYYIMIDGYAGDRCNYTFGVQTGVALTCNTCLGASCATNSVAADYYTLKTAYINNGNWNTFGATPAVGTPYTATGTAKGPNTVCTDITPNSSSFIGLDYLINASGTAAQIDEIRTKGIFTLVSVTQEITAGVCTTLIPSGTLPNGMPYFNNTGGTIGTTAGAFDSTKPIKVCISYALPATANLGGTVSGVIVMGYGCAIPTSLSVGSQTACSSGNYDQTLTINFNPINLPYPAQQGGTSNVDLVVNGQSFTITPTEQVAGSKTIILTNLVGDGTSVNVEAYFTLNIACKLNVTNAFTKRTCGCASPPSVTITSPTTVDACVGTPITINYTTANGVANITRTGTGTLSKTTTLANETSSFTYTPVEADRNQISTITLQIPDPDGAGACLASTRTVTVNVSQVVPTVNITPTIVYPGTSTIVANATGIGVGTILYNFKKGGVSQQNTSSNIWNATGLLVGDIITCEITITGNQCLSTNTATSNVVTVASTPNINYCDAIVQLPDQSITCGSNISLNSTTRTIYNITRTNCNPITAVSPTLVTLSDDAVTSNLNVGFNFNFFGTNYTQFRIHSNGIVSFGNQTYTGYTAVSIPNGAAAPNNYIAGLYTDLDPRCGGTISYETIGTAPNRRLVVSFTDIRPYNGGLSCNAPASQAVSFQIVLNETTNEINVIVIKFPSTFLTWGSGNATQGVEANDGSIAFTTPGRNWQDWRNIVPENKDCTTFGPINYTASFIGWTLNGANVSNSANATFNNISSNRTYIANWLINGNTCTDDVLITATGSPTMTTSTITNSSNCASPNGSIAFTFTNLPDGTYTLNYTKDAIATSASITVTTNTATLSNLNGGVYNNFSISNSGCTATYNTPVTIGSPDTPNVTGVSICQNSSSQSMTSSTVCPGGGSTIAQNTTFNIGSLSASDPTWTRVFTTSCGPSSTNGVYYDTFTFQVSQTGSYTFSMCTPGTNWDGLAALYQTSFNATSQCTNFITSNDDGNSGGNCENDAMITQTLTAGTTYILVTTSFSASITGNYQWVYTGPTGATISTIGTPNVLQWYTAPSGGTHIGTGSSFNPVGMAGSGLANTSVAGTTIYYVACSSTPDCRAAVNYTINPAPLTLSVILTPSTLFVGNQTIIATANNTGGGTVNYNFKKNNISQQNSTSNIWNATGLLSGDIITCDITVTGGACLVSNTATSNIVIVKPLPLSSSVRGTALSFNGTNQSVNIPDANVLDMTNNYTLEVWIKFGNLTGTAGIISKNSSSNNGYFLRRNGGELVFDGLTTSGLTLNTTDWHHIAAVNNNGTRSLYVNGWNISLSGTPINVIANTNNLNIGYDAQSNTYLQGQIDEIRIWEFPRSQFDLRENMHLVLTGAEAGLISYYQCNETAGTTIGDITNTLTGTLQNAPTWLISHANVGRGVSFTKNINLSGAHTFTGTNCNLTFGGSSIPNGDVVVSRIQGVAAGVILITPNVGFTKSVHNNYWVINNFGTNNTNMDITPTFTLGAGQISPTEVAADLKLNKRPTNKDIAWTPYDAVSYIASTGEIVFNNITDFSEFVISSNGNIPLPVSTINFYGERINQEHILLKWQTNHQQNDKMFEIEMSNNGVDFHKIGVLDALNNNETIKNYFFRTNNRFAAYYRLKQIDNNNNFAYTNIIFIDGIKNMFAIYPNPMQEILHIDMNDIDKTKENLRISLNTLSGQILFEKTGNWQQVEDELQNYMSKKLSNGMYILQLHHQSKMQIFKIQKNK